MEDNHHQFRNLLLHHLMAKPPPQQQIQYQLQHQQQQQQQQHNSLLRSQMFIQQPQEQTAAPAIAQIQQQPTRKRAYTASRKAEAASAGAIVEVQGGHIIRSIGRKDRHSKVCTAKGPRDRRVRLAAHTAIQFYDVQDRLGYDRPSKAVDWLLKKAQSSIDELDELPPWKPTASTPNNNDNNSTKTIAGDEAEEEGGGSGIYAANNDESSSLLPPSMDSNPIEAAPVQFQSYQSQDLKLSLQSQDHHRNQQQCSHQNQEEDHQSSSFQSAQIGFSSAGWDAENSQPAELGRFQRLIGSWNLAGGSYSGNGNGNGNGFMFIPPPQPMQQPMLFGQAAAAATHFFSQRGTLQSNNNNNNNNNNTPLVTASKNHHQGVSVHPVSFSGIGFGSSGGGFSSFHIQGDHEEEQDGKPSSVASGSRH